MPGPLLSVILACRNPGPGIRLALDSVWAQLPEPPEVVVIDGSSTDGTRQWLESQRARMSTLVSEPDSGVYAAMNLGARAARGDWLLFLGADDRLASRSTVADAAPWLRQTDAGVLVCEATFTDGRTFGPGPQRHVRARNFVHHQAAFYRRSLLVSHGGFNESLRVMADYDLNLRLWRRGVAFGSAGLPITVCGVGGLSDSGRWRGYAEEIRVRHRHFPAWQCWPWDAGSLARFLRKRFLVTVRGPAPGAA
jgi:putative colanic acid biosynthesis glycosyltransferase WcaE